MIYHYLINSTSMWQFFKFFIFVCWSHFDRSAWSQKIFKQFLHAKYITSHLPKSNWWILCIPINGIFWLSPTIVLSTKPIQIRNWLLFFMKTEECGILPASRGGHLQAIVACHLSRGSGWGKKKVHLLCWHILQHRSGIKTNPFQYLRCHSSTVR